MAPKPTENVIAVKADHGGRVTVHGWRQEQYGIDYRPITDCGRQMPNHRGWLWLEFRMLNPERLSLCKMCWGGDS